MIAGRCTASRWGSRTSSTCSTGRPLAGQSCWKDSYRPAGCARRGASPAGRGRPHRQDGDDPVRQLRPAADAQPVEPARTPGGIEQRLGGGGGVWHVPGGAGLANGRLDHPAGFVLRRGEFQADLRNHAPGGSADSGPFNGSSRADGPKRARRGSARADHPRERPRRLGSPPGAFTDRTSPRPTAWTVRSSRQPGGPRNDGARTARRSSIAGRRSRTWFCPRSSRR